MPDRITDALVRRAPSPPRGSTLTFDTDITGFALRVTAASGRAFVLNYRVDGRERRYTIGRYPDWTVAAARAEARQLRRRVDRGDDITGERHARREAPTVRELAADYAREHLPKKRPRSRATDLAMLEHHILPVLGNLKVEDVPHRDVMALHRSMAHYPTQANRVAALLSKIFNLAVKWGVRPDNPVRGLERYPETPRTRYLTPAEMERLSAALDAARSRTAANVVRWCLLTGCRVGEALAARWDDIDAESGTWTKPDATTKQNREHRIPLSAPARVLLDGLDGDRDGYLFPGPDGSPIQSIKTAWGTIRRAAALPDLRLHDLRHSHAALLASSGASLLLIGRLLGHTQAQTTQRYAHLMDDPLREATERVGAIVAGGPKATVRKIRR